MAETMATSTDDTNVESTRTQCDCSQQQLIEARAQLTALEQSNETLQKKLDGYRKDNENLVIKYAFVEKKVLDLKALVGDKDSQLKRHEQEVASLQKQIGTLKADKAKLQKNIESKQRDVERLGKELEGSRHYAAQIEMRYKYGSCRLRREAEDRMKLEAEVLTLRQQLLQHVIAEETHQASEQVAEMERKVMELQAREIMLKHANDEQAGRIGTLQRANHELRDTIERQEKKHTSTLQTLKELETERDHLRQQMGQLQESFHQQQAAIAELQSKVEAASVAAQESSRMERAVAEQRAELEQLAGTLDEQRKDLEVLAARELELLALNKDLSEVNCLLQQEIATQESKTIAITLEYGKFVSMCQEYDAQIVSLANSLAAERQHRTEERLLMAKHIADRTRKLEQAESCLQQTLNELEANRKKYFALVKDFKREMKNAHCGVESSMVGQ
ncbi:protein Hook homolog 1 isoform X1 [Anopheles gambiae]|uniref:protein Hook homolog 1-like isoform X1 n=1 Tax=Anopheles coluzzii TaxID=1518534 RepID=UPI0020FFD53B|nr:protein Hook homolog 1-like isoform X1 [Anopheles coluzzii]XP_061513630.1 protein Hook homolog 1 isoform X1 [Anopheles gambiae]